MALDHICTKCKSFTESRNLLRKNNTYLCRDCYYSTIECDGCNKEVSIVHEVQGFNSITYLCNGCYLKFNQLPLTNYSLN